MECPTLSLQSLAAGFALLPDAMNEQELGSFDEYCGFKLPSDPMDDNIDPSILSDNIGIMNNRNNSNRKSNSSNNSNTVTSSSSNITTTTTLSNNTTTTGLLPPTPCDANTELPALDSWYWQSTESLAQVYSQVSPLSTFALTPELSPATSSFTPSTLGTPLGFDSMGLAEVANSPALEFDASFDQINYDFAADFQLFPDPPAKTAAVSVATIDFSKDALLYVPVKTESFVVAKALGQDVAVPQVGVAPRKPVQSPTKPGFQPAKRRRRRRITTEEAARVMPEENQDDPNAKARFKCFVCNKTFSRPYNLRSHRKIHEGIKPYICSHKDDEGKICAWAFARKHDLERHVSSRHTIVKTFTCETCGKKCSRSDAYKKHVARHGFSEQSADDQETQECNKVSNLRSLEMWDFDFAEEY